MKEKDVVVVNENERDDKPDCFAWLSTLKCNALSKKCCKNCSFYKHKSQVPNYEKYLIEERKERNKKK